MRENFFNAIRTSLFGGELSQAQVDGINLLIDEGLSQGITSRRFHAYVLATVFHETGRRMQPVRETFADTDIQAVQRLEAAWRAGKLKWVKTPYWRTDASGNSWFGRGYVQITHKTNYEKLGRAIGADLVSAPTAALDPAIASQIAWVGMLRGLFTGYDLYEANTAATDGSYADDRKIINGTESASKVAAYAEQFDAAFRRAPDMLMADVPPPAPLPDVTLWVNFALRNDPAMVVAQQRLLTLRYPVGMADGDWGPRTIGALASFRATNGIPAVEDDVKKARIDSVTYERLFDSYAKPMPISAERAEAKPEDIKEAIPEVAKPVERQGFWTRILAWVSGLGTGLGVLVDNLAGATTQVSTIKGLLGSLPWWVYAILLVLILVGVAKGASAISGGLSKAFAKGKV